MVTYCQVLEQESVEFAVNMNLEKTKKLVFVENITLIQSKVAMDSYDNKRLWSGCNTSIPYGMKTAKTISIDVRWRRNLCARIQKYCDVDGHTIMKSADARSCNLWIT